MAATGAEVHCLEHDPGFLYKLNDAKTRCGLDNLHIHFAPLVDGWYSDVDLPWTECDVVLCDGPPRKGNDREVLFQRMIDNECWPRIILKDDTDTIPEVLGYEFEIMGALRKFAVGRQDYDYDRSISC